MRIRTPRVYATTALAALTALTLTACAPDEAAEFEENDSASTEADPAGEVEETEAPENDGPETEDPENGPAEEADSEDSGAEDEQTDSSSDAIDTPEGPIDPEDAIDSVTFNIPSSDIDGTMTVGLHHLRVEGNTLQLLLSYTPDFGEHETYSIRNLYSDTVHPTLADMENLKRYTVLRSHGGHGDYWATNINQDIADGESLLYWAHYPIPEDEIDTVDLQIHSAAPRIEGAEIAWGDAEPAEDLGEGDADVDTEEDAEEGSE